MKHTSKTRVLSPGVVIGYSEHHGHGSNYPDPAVRTGIVNAVANARETMRTASRKMDRVVLFADPKASRSPA